MAENGKNGRKQVNWDGWKGSDVEPIVEDFLKKFEAGEVFEVDVETAFKILDTIHGNKEMIEKWREMMKTKPNYVMKDVLGGYIVQIATRKWQTKFIEVDTEKSRIRIGKPIAENKRKGGRRKRAETEQETENKQEVEQESQEQEENAAEELANVEVELPETLELPDVEVSM